jgi:drug/metabolite transporter (DMT)-like permease
MRACDIHIYRRTPLANLTGGIILLPIILILLSALIHAIWNLQLKRSRDKTLFSYLYILSAILLYTPVFILTVPGTILQWEGVVAAITTGTIYCFYFLLLARSYSGGDLSMSYPVARGVAPLLTLVWAVLLLGERPSITGLFGIGVIVASIYLFHPPRGAGRDLVDRMFTPAFAAALGTGLSISAYSTVDKVGVSFITPYIYIYLTFSVAAILLTPFYLRRYGFRAIGDEIRFEWKRALMVGLMCIYGYLLVLFAMELVQVSYIIPLRSTSILFAVILGFEVLDEEKSSRKVLATVSMVAGVLLIAFS